MGKLPEYFQEIESVGTGALTLLTALEAMMRRLHPPELRAVAGFLKGPRDDLVSHCNDFDSTIVSDDSVEFHSYLWKAAELAREAADKIIETGSGRGDISDILGAMHCFARAQECLYTINLFPPIGRFFSEPEVAEAVATRIDALAGRPRDVSTGLHQSSINNDGGERGEFCLYVPEYYDDERSWPVVVALHGGSGNGRDFVWTWLREARSRGFLLLSPTASGSTWSLDEPTRDMERLSSMLGHIASRWSVDRNKLLLTGLSDGATFSLLAGLSEGSPFAAIAPICGVLHPQNLINGNLERAKDRKIYWVQGSLDWMFPVELARDATTRLKQNGAAMIYRELADLSHTYPREENGLILEWFDPELALDKAEQRLSQ